MGELNINFHVRGKKGGARRAKKLSTRVDLTPMVDLGFLLITFFIVTTTLSKQRVMKFILPADGDGTYIPQSAALTIVPLYDNNVFYYYGSLADAIKYKQFGTCDYSFDNGIGNVIRKKQVALDKKIIFKKGRKEMVVVIKPSYSSDYNHIVKVFDEMLINNVGKYSLVDIGEEETKSIAGLGISMEAVK